MTAPPTNQLLQSIQDVLAARSVRKAVWLALVLVFSLTFLEAYTQYFASTSLSSRLKLIEEADQPGASPERRAQLAQIRDQLIGDIVRLEEERKSPQVALEAAFIRFIKGAYIFVPIGWLVLKYTLRFTVRANDPSLRTGGLLLGYFAFSAALWCATLLGLVSVVWNRSSSILVSWFLFPLCATALLAIVGLWLAMLKSSLPQERAPNQQPTKSVQPGSPTGSPPEA